MHSRLALVLPAVAAVLSGGAPAGAQDPEALGRRPEDCIPVVNQQLDRLGIKDVRRIFFSRQISGSGGFLGDGGGRVVGYEAWVKLQRCDGSLVVDLTPECWVRQVYTRSYCTIDGLPHFW